VFRNSPASKASKNGQILDRRAVLKAAGTASLSLLLPTQQLLALSDGEVPVRAIAFDGFPIFDPRSVLATANGAFPDQPDLGQAWFAKIFAYTWLRTSGKRYSDFMTVAGQALDATLATRGLTMGGDHRAEMLGAWMSLKLWPDVEPTLERLDAGGIRFCFLSNLTEEMLRTNARSCGMEGAFDYLSTDRVEAFKPAPRAYQMGVDHFGLRKDEIAFCAFAAWDAAGASWFGYPTMWINRLGQPPEELGAAAPVAQDRSIEVLTRVIPA